MKWPLSMSFAKLISRTADAGHARYTLPGPGLLNPDTKYFWHVRAEMTRGSGDRGAHLELHAARTSSSSRISASNSTATRNRGVLRWAPNPLGRKPVAYRVYASDEKGFSVERHALQGHGGSLREAALGIPRELRGRNLGDASWKWWALM